MNKAIIIKLIKHYENLIETLTPAYNNANEAFQLSYKKLYEPTITDDEFDIRMEQWEECEKNYHKIAEEIIMYDDIILSLKDALNLISKVE